MFLDSSCQYLTLNSADTVWKDAPFFFAPFLVPPAAASAVMPHLKLTIQSKQSISL